MNAKTLSRLLKEGRARAEAAHLEGLQALYEEALVKLGRESLTNFRALTAAGWQPPTEGSLLTLASLVALQESLNNGLAPIWQRILLDIAATPLERLRIDWNVTHPLAADLLEKAGTRTGQNLGDAVDVLLREVIGQAYTAGLSVTETADEIQATLSDAAPWQAEMLARTDLNSLANGASQAAARLVGAGYKTWLATNDARTRETHAEADGQTVPINSPFDVGGESLDYPGDPAGSDAEVINCRCTMIYADSLDEANTLLAAGGRTMTAMETLGNETAAASAKFKRGHGLTAAVLPEVRWVSDLAFEGEATSDGRYILPGALSWRDLPLTLMAQTVTDDGHDGAFVAGRIDKISKRAKNIDGDALTDGMKSLHGEGVFDMGGENGAEIARLVGDETLRGVSIDMGIIEWVMRDPKTGETIVPSEATPEQMDRFFFGELQFAVKEAEILAATVCPTPAFSNAKIALSASARRARIVSSFRIEPQTLLAATAPPARAPAAWFDVAEPPGKMPLTITDEGRVFGHLACWDQCHMSFLPACVPPPKSASNYAYFHAGELTTAEGERIAVGKLMVGGRHDSNLSHSREEAMRHYDDTSRVGAFLRAVDGRHGIWVCGFVNPKLTADQLDELRLNPPSGDWRVVNGMHELICGLAVPVPGFATPRAEMVLVASGDDLTMGALVASLGPSEPDPAALAELVSIGVLSEAEAEALDVEGVDRRIRVLAARAEGIDALAALAEA